MELKCQNLGRNGIKNETSECILILRHKKAFKSSIIDSVSFQILTFQCHSMATFLLGIGLRGTGVLFVIIRSCYRNLTAPMLIFTLLSTLVKYTHTQRPSASSE